MNCPICRFVIDDGEKTRPWELIHHEHGELIRTQTTVHEKCALRVEQQRAQGKERIEPK